VSDAYSATLKLLQGRFIDGLPEMLRPVKETLGRENVELAEIHDLHRILHEAAGNAGMLGFTDLHRLLKDALRMLETAEAENRTLTDPERNALIVALAGIMRAREAAL